MKDYYNFQEFVQQRRVFVHPHHKFPQLYNDIALIELDRRIIFDYDGKKFNIDIIIIANILTQTNILVLGDTPLCISSGNDLDEKLASIYVSEIFEKQSSCECINNLLN